MSPSKLDVAILAPTPTPYRAFEFDSVQRALADECRFHALFLERHWSDHGWVRDMPEIMAWDVLPSVPVPSKLRRLPGLARVNRGTTEVLDRIDPDVVLLHGYDAPALWVALRWARARGRGVLFRSDSNVLAERRKSTWKRAAKEAIVRPLFQAVDGFLAVGRRNAQFYESFGVERDRIFHAPFLIDAETFRAKANSQRRTGQSLKRELGIHAKTVLMFVGRFTEAKGITTAISAFARLADRAGDSVFLLVGDGPLREELQEQARPLGERVKFAGFRQPDEVAELLGIADALVVPSTHEPWGLVVNEAMAAGLMVIASDEVGAATDLVVAGETGLLFPAGDVDALAHCFYEVIADGETVRLMGTAGQLRLRSWVGPEQVSFTYNQAIRFALGRAELTAESKSR